MRKDAVAFLQHLLASGGMRAEEVLQEGRKVGVSEKTLRRAKARLGIKVRRRGGVGPGGWWEWELPPKMATKMAREPDVAILAKGEHLSIDAPKMASYSHAGHLSSEVGHLSSPGALPEDATKGAISLPPKNPGYLRSKTGQTGQIGQLHSPKKNPGYLRSKTGQTGQIGQKGLDQAVREHQGLL